MLKGKIPCYIERPINIVDVADVGRGHVLAALKGRIGERYILGGHNTFVSQMMKSICDLGGVCPPQLKLPLGMAVVPSMLSEFFGYYIFNSIPALPVLGLRFVQYGQHLTCHKAEKELGYTISPMEPCYLQAMAWYRKIGYC